MMKRVIAILCVVPLVALLLASGLGGCVEDTPYYQPESPSSRGPLGTSAFVSGESTATAFKPVKDGALEAPAAPPTEEEDETNGETPAEDPDDELDFDFGPSS